MNELIALPGLNPDQHVHSLRAQSGGQRPRALNPKLMFCDELVSALDVSIQSKILNPLMQLKNELGLSNLFIAHDLLVVRHTSGRVAVMYLGVVVEEGIADEIFANRVHPYIEVIWSAIPVPDPTLRGKRNCIIPEADLPSLLHPAKGCLFVTPCPLAEQSCKNESRNLSKPRRDISFCVQSGYFNKFNKLHYAFSRYAGTK